MQRHADNSRCHQTRCCCCCRYAVRAVRCASNPLPRGGFDPTQANSPTARRLLLMAWMSILRPTGSSSVHRPWTPMTALLLLLVLLLLVLPQV